MVLTKQDFLIKAGLLVAAVAVSSLHWSITMNPNGEALFHLGSVLALVGLVPIIAVVPGALFFGVAALVMDDRTRDHTRACFLMGLYVVVLLMVCFNVIKIADFPQPPSAKGGSVFYWYLAYVWFFFYSLPGVNVIPTQQQVDQQKAQKQQIAQRSGINRWLLIGGASFLVFAVIVLVFWMAADLDFALSLGGILGGVTAAIFGLLMFLSDAVFGQLRFWKITFSKRLDAFAEERMRQNRAREERERKTKAEDGRAREQRTRDSSSKAGNTGSGRSPNSIHFDHYFRILEIQPSARIDEVKAAYKRRMQEYHPDKVASLGKELRDLADAKSKEINAAYRAIMDALGA